MPKGRYVCEKIDPELCQYCGYGDFEPHYRRTDITREGPCKLTLPGNLTPRNLDPLLAEGIATYRFYEYLKSGQSEK